MTDHLPKISVCIPAYNCSHYLKPALESVLQQTMQDFEVIVYDDASTDDTPHVVAAFQEPRIRYFRQSRNVGEAANRNSCLSVARGQYISWVDADDLCYPEMLAIQSAKLDQHPDIGLVFGAYHIIDEHGQRLPDWSRPFSSDVMLNGQEAFRELILANYIVTPALMIRQKCHHQAGSFRPEIGKCATDWDMWLRLVLQTDIAYTSTPLGLYRQHNRNLTATTGEDEWLRCEIRVVQHVLPLAREVVANFETLQRQAQAAIAAKVLQYCNDAFIRRDRSEALQVIARGYRFSRPVMNADLTLRLLTAVIKRNQYIFFRIRRELLRPLSRDLEGTRLGNRILKQLQSKPEWQETQQRIAQIIRQHVPKKARVLIVDKWDPTLFHLSQRQGWNYPDRRLLPGGYPCDDATAIAHLDQLRKRGADYMVFPNASFWWLDFYKELHQHLEAEHTCIWRDEKCVIYQLTI